MSAYVGSSKDLKDLKGAQRPYLDGHHSPLNHRLEILRAKGVGFLLHSHRKVLKSSVHSSVRKCLQFHEFHHQESFLLVRVQRCLLVSFPLKSKTLPCLCRRWCLGLNQAYTQCSTHTTALTPHHHTPRDLYPPYEVDAAALNPPI